MAMKGSHGARQRDYGGQREEVLMGCCGDFGEIEEI